jgi:hypothetical protein
MGGVATASTGSIDRRSLLAGAGIVTFGGLLVGRSEADPPVVVEELRLFAADLRHSIPGVEPGEFPPVDARPVPHAELSREDGGSAGALASVSVPSTGGAAVLHTFTLDDGTLLGVGPSEIAGPHAIVGGSGRYASASGTYTVHAQRDGHLILISLRRGNR